MIFKENNNASPTDKLAKAGYDAERKVAFYLNRFFGENPDLLILNDLRVESGEITAQMDHLIIHQHGIIIIESKSVAGKLQVQDDGQWIRWYAQSNAKDKSIGMPNPIKQAKIQGLTLMDVLSKAVNENARPALKALPVDVLVAFSNHNGGVFIAKDKTLYPEVCPADAIDDRVNEILAKRANNPQDFSLSETNRDKLANYLIKINKPYQAPITVTNKTYQRPETEVLLKVRQDVTEFAPVENPSSISGSPAGVVSNTLTSPQSKFKHVCRKCKSEKLEATYGRNYYFKCLSCDENTPITANCILCKEPLKIRKDKNQFFAECKKCNTSELFYVND